VEIPKDAEIKPVKKMAPVLEETASAHEPIVNPVMKILGQLETLGH
jgi:hypothetical protein